MSSLFHINDKKNLSKIRPTHIYNSPVKKRNTVTFENNETKLYDRFLPFGISPNLNCDPPSYSKYQDSNSPDNQFKKNSSKKNNYQRVLLANLLSINDSSPELTKDTKKNIFLLDLKNAKRKVSYSKNKFNKLNKSSNNSLLNNIITNDYSLLARKNKKKLKPIIKPNKIIYFGDKTEIFPKYKNIQRETSKLPDNYYYNILDMYNISSILISTNDGGTSLIDFSKDEYRINEININPDNCLSSKGSDYFSISNPIVICNKFPQDSNSFFLSSTTNNDLLYTDLNKNTSDAILSKYDAAFYTFDIINNFVLLGEENGRVEFLDIRECHINGKNISYLYTHPGKNELCKIFYSQINKYIISGGNDDNGIIFDYRSNKIIKKIHHKGAIKALTLNKNENLLLSGGGNKDRTLKIWDLKKLNLISENKANSQITGVEFLNDNCIFVSFGYNENMSIVYNLDFDKLYKETINDNQLCDVKLSFDVKDEMNNNIIDVFNIEDTFEKHSKRILYLSKDRLNQYIATASESELKIFQISKYYNNQLKMEESLNYH